MAVQIFDHLRAEFDDIAQMRDARHAQLRRDRPGKPPHRKTVRMKQVGCEMFNAPGEFLASTRGDRLVRRLVEHGGELLAPVRQARPGEVRVARCMVLAERRRPTPRVGFVAASVMRRCAIRPIEVVDGHVGRLVRPPDHDGRVGQQQPGDEALEVRAAGFAERAQRDDLARAGVAADADLRIEARIGVGSLSIMSTMTRIGCSREASFAASMTSSIARRRA